LSTAVHHLALLARTHTVLIAPVVLLGVGLMLVAAPGRTAAVGLALVAALHFGVLTLPAGLRHQVAVEEGVATTDAVACRLGAIGRPLHVCPPIVIRSPFHNPIRILP
jgi:hypothetical protein